MGLINEKADEVMRQTIALHYLLKKQKQDELADAVLNFGQSLAEFTTMTDSITTQGKEEHD